MKPGKLWHRISLARAGTQTLDEYGEATDDARELAPLWAAVEPLSSRELYYSQQVHPTATHKITLRYDPAIVLTHNDRILFGTRTFQVVAVRNIEERNREVEVICEEVQA